MSDRNEIVVVYPFKIALFGDNLLHVKLFNIIRKYL